MPIQGRDLPIRIHVSRRSILSAQLEQTRQEPLGLTHVHELPAEVGARGRESRLTRKRAERAAVVGKAGLIWLAAYVFSVHELSPGFALLGAAAVSAVWYAALQATAPSTRLIMPVLGHIGQAVLGSAAGFAAVSGLALWAPWLHLSPLVVIEMSLIVVFFASAWGSIVARSPAARRRVLVVGSADGGAELVDQIALTSNCPFEVIGFVDDERTSEQIAGTTRFGGLEDLPWVLDVQRPDLVVLAVARNRPEAFASLLRGAGTGFELLGLAEFHEQAFGRVPIRHLTPAWFMSVLHFYRRPYTRLTKRIFDLLVASLGLLLTAPLFPVIWLLVRRTPGPAVFRQTRLGEGGGHFTMLKFRTMHADAEGAGLPVWAKEHDPRITGIGRFLRKTRLDELPQLWNVVRGDMSIVGPRPERPEFLEFLHQAVPFWSRRHLVKPGITGWAQLRRGYTADAEGTTEKLSYDLWYLRHRSLIVDLAICARTVSVLFSGSGSR